MIARISGKLIERREHSIILDVGGISYEVLTPYPVMERIDEAKDNEGRINLITYHYLQVTPSSAVPVLIGFINEMERDFFQQFITVSGIGPRAAVKALSKPISAITRAIEEGDTAYLKTLSGIGVQKAKEIVAKLQGKVGRFGLIKDKAIAAPRPAGESDWQKEALDVLIQLQYKKHEAQDMINRALERSADITTTEELLNEIYKLRVKV